jgi:5-methylcytosine-specific restriction protein B
MNEYDKFKKLLEYFVAHLEFCVSDQKFGEGYETYIKEIKNFKRGGQGHKEQQIQNQIKGWDIYDNGKICINVNPTTYQSGGTYLNWKHTAINVNAEWVGKKIVSLKIMRDSYPLSNAKHVMTTNVSDLGFFDNNIPNDNLKSFFDKFNSLIIEWNENENNRQLMANIKPYTQLLEDAKNIILTGAPGTGKTFLAKQIAKQMIGVQTDLELEESGQFAFVQFHPSYDYTDFVEGLRPTKPDSNGIIGFELKNGIFKEFCKKAIGVSAVTVGHIDKFTLDDYVKYLQTLGLKEITFKTYKNRLEQLLGKEINSKRDITNIETYASLEEICEYVDDIKDFDTINNFHNQFSAAVTNLISFRDDLSTKQQKTNEIKPVFVFVIDEINRGEISKIFGELFFSIDPSYRGKKGAVKTQYSNLHSDDKEVFYVPDNVYIIGSMNDIDRSVESFDFAMRRRFTWSEITAEQSADNMNLPEESKSKMAKLNEQISDIEGLNPSFHIGAAYFLDTNGNVRQDYDNIWNLRIEPLLKEYLRGMPDSSDKIDLLKNAFIL